MHHTVSDSKIIILNMNRGETYNMFEKNVNNSVEINNSTVTASQFASGAKSFKGKINNVTTQVNELDELTEQLINAVKNEASFVGENKEELIDAIEQARKGATSKVVNKLSLNGILTGINTFMTGMNNLSSNTSQLYTKWYEYFSQLF